MHHRSTNLLMGHQNMIRWYAVRNMLLWLSVVIKAVGGGSLGCVIHSLLLPCIDLGYRILHEISLLLGSVVLIIVLWHLLLLMLVINLLLFVV